MSGPHASTLDDTDLPDEEQLRRWCRQVCGGGARTTASPRHDVLIDWLTDELLGIPGLDVRAEEFGLRRWLPSPDLARAASLRRSRDELAVAGAVPYSRPGTAHGELVHLPAGTDITAGNAAGRVVLRDFPHLPVAYGALTASALRTTPDLLAMHDEIWDRPGLADGLLHADLLAAGRAGAAGVVFGFDLPREQVAGYHEPHKGTHYELPAVFVGDEVRRDLLGSVGALVELRVDAAVSPATTTNVHAVLPGRSAERVVIVTHTDGNTWVQENGVVGLLGLARCFAARPAGGRARTIEFAFTSAHLHISREGSARYAAVLDEEFDGGGIAYVVALEHLGVRELAPRSRGDEPGRFLEFTGDPELVLWSVGPSRAMQDAVIGAVDAHELPRTMVTPGLGAPVDGRVPAIASLGGLGTHYHTHLLPTTAVLTAPWSLWAPSFGSDAVDVALMRRQLAAVVDVVDRLGDLDREIIAGGYLDDRVARTSGATTATEPVPPELASEAP